MIYTQPGSSFTARVDGFPTGGAGTVGVQILNASGGVALARSTAGIVESPAASGSYIVTLVAPATVGQYSVFWDSGTITPSTTAAEDLTVTGAIPVGSTSPNYITLAALKVTLGITNTAADADLNASIAAASRAIDQLCQRRFYIDANASSVRYYSPARWGHLDIDDLVVLTTLLSADDGTTTFANTWTVNVDFYLEPENALADQEQWPYTRLRCNPSGGFTFNTYYPRSVQVTAQFGWPAVPSAIIDATTMVAERVFKQKREAPLGILAFEQMAIRVARSIVPMDLVSPYMKHRASIG